MGIEIELWVLFAGDGRRNVYDKSLNGTAEDNRIEFNCTHAVVNLKPQ